MKKSVTKSLVVCSLLWIFVFSDISAQSSKELITKRHPISRIEQDTFLVKDILTVTSKDIPSSCDYYLIILSDTNNYEYCVVSSYCRTHRKSITVGERHYFQLYPQFKLNLFPGTYYFEIRYRKRIFKVASQMRFMNVYLSPNLRGLSYKAHSVKSRDKGCKTEDFEK